MGNQRAEQGFASEYTEQNKQQQREKKEEWVVEQ